MLLTNALRITDDIDMFWLEEGEAFQKPRRALRDGVQAITSKYRLPPHWFNHLTQTLIYDKMIMPRDKVKKQLFMEHDLPLLCRSTT